MNYTALQAAVAGYLHRSDLGTTEIPSYFIEFARLRIGRDVRALANLKSGTVATWSAGIGTLPADVSKIRSVYVDGTVMTYVSAEQLSAYATASAPQVYSVQGTQKIIIPGIGASTSASLEYWAIPAALSSGTDVSAGMNEWPHVWIHAAVLEAAFWERDWSTYNQMLPIYQAEVSALNAACADAIVGTSPMVITDQPMIQGMSRL